MKDQNKPGVPCAVVERAIARATDYKHTFTTKQGKAVLLDLLQEHFMLRNTYNGPEPDDGRGMAFKEGQRSVVIRILTMMDLDVAEMHLLLKQGDDDVRNRKNS